ncbi:MAG: D-alanyl-D-alanine carboxypeptidase family protein [Oscillospiraceae bacterium]|nr:D-alanyl-D-alanine carboxypeptidase family protein [Oscillospiraceae bacterium]
MKKFLCILASVVLLLGTIKTDIADALSFTPTLKDKISSEAVVLYNIDTTSVVYEKNPDKQMNPVQLVQIMTAVIVLENVTDLNQKYECPVEIYDEFTRYSDTYPAEQFPYNEVTLCDLDAGDAVTVKELLYAMMLSSSCEAAGTLAYHVGDGSVEKFVEMMNQKAKEIGAVNTKFTNPHGLYDENQYTTASDMMTITEYAMTVPGFIEIASANTYKIPSSDTLSVEINLSNRNLMMNADSEYYYPNAKGIKTGSSGQSGRCLVTKASKDGQSYIIVLMSSPLGLDNDESYTNLKDATALFDWAFDKIKHTTILQSTEEIQTVKVNYAVGRKSINLRPAEDVQCMWESTLNTASIDTSDITYLYKELNAPIKAGDKIATLTLRYSGDVIDTVDLVAYSDVERSIFKYSSEIINSYFKSASFKNALRIACALSVLYIILVLYVANKRMKKRREKRLAQSRKR